MTDAPPCLPYAFLSDKEKEWLYENVANIVYDALLATRPDNVSDEEKAIPNDIFQ